MIVGCVSREVFCVLFLLVVWTCPSGCVCVVVSVHSVSWELRADAA